MTVDLKSKLFSKPPKNSDFYIVAVDGRDGTGKTTLAEHVAAPCSNADPVASPVRGTQ